MAIVDVVNAVGNKVSQTNLNDAIFDVEISKGILHQVVVSQLSKRRQGTASVKGRSDVIGSGRKLYRQKGMGRARKGDVKSPLLRGGGVVFGPVVRSYKKKVMKKVARAALRMALSSKLKENSIIVLDEFGLKNAKTRNFIKVINILGVSNLLIVTSEQDVNLELSSRNVSGIKVIKCDGLNVFDILKYSVLIILESSIKKIERRLL